jgi:integrase
MQALGDRPIDKFKPKDAVIFRDRLLARGLTVESAKRSFAGLRAIINFSVRELGLDYRSPFSNALMPNLNDSVCRQPIPLSTIKEVQRACFQSYDDPRWLIAILADTGMRLAECVGLAVTDLKLEGNVPHIDLKPNLWRPLKTPTSARKVPLVGSALWAARRVSDAVEGHYAFPRYTDGVSCKANSASASVNKWLKPQVPVPSCSHP